MVSLIGLISMQSQVKKDLKSLSSDLRFIVIVMIVYSFGFIWNKIQKIYEFFFKKKIITIKGTILAVDPIYYPFSSNNNNLFENELIKIGFWIEVSTESGSKRIKALLINNSGCNLEVAKSFVGKCHYYFYRKNTYILDKIL